MSYDREVAVAGAPEGSPRSLQINSTNAYFGGSTNRVLATEPRAGPKCEIQISSAECGPIVVREPFEIKEGVIGTLNRANQLSSLSSTAALSRFWVFWIRNTMRNVTIVVPVLMTNCQVSVKPNSGPVPTQTTIVNPARPNVRGWPAEWAIFLAIRANAELRYVDRLNVAAASFASCSSFYLPEALARKRKPAGSDDPAGFAIRSARRFSNPGGPRRAS